MIAQGFCLFHELVYRALAASLAADAVLGGKLCGAVDRTKALWEHNKPLVDARIGKSALMNVVLERYIKLVDNRRLKSKELKDLLENRVERVYEE